MLHLMSYCSPRFIDLVKTYLIPSLPKEFEYLDLVITNKDTEYWLQQEFMVRRIEAMRDKVLAYQGEQLMFVDADVIFSKKFKSSQVLDLLKTNDILFQLNGNWPYNTGVWIANCTPQILEVFTKWVEVIREQKTITIHNSDQAIINAMLVECNIKKHTNLPIEFSASHMDNIYLSYQTLGQQKPNPDTYGIYKSMPPNTVLFHATGAYTLPEKIKVLQWAKENMQ